MARFANVEAGEWDLGSAITVLIGHEQRWPMPGPTELGANGDMHMPRSREGCATEHRSDGEIRRSVIADCAEPADVR
jgi:hypothetical protein